MDRGDAFDPDCPTRVVLDRIGDKWTVLVIGALEAGPLRFTEVRARIGGIAPKVLTQTLRAMERDGLLTRTVHAQVPPRVDYELTERARALLPVVGELARWGYHWAWGPPRPGEAVDIGAILRAATGLVMPRPLDGVFEIRVTHPERGVLVYTLTVEDGALRYAECGAPDADARISGPERAFVEVFIEQGARTELDVEGDVLLAEQLIGVLRDGARAAAIA